MQQLHSVNIDNALPPQNNAGKVLSQNAHSDNEGVRLPEILFITSYPPRECGIASYSHDLIKALNNKFSQSFKIKICHLVDPDNEPLTYPDEIEYSLNTNHPAEYIGMAKIVNDNAAIRMVVIQHEFGFFNQREHLLQIFLKTVSKPLIIVFHTVLPHPGEPLKNQVQDIAAEAASVIVMTSTSAKILLNDYQVPSEKITVIAHGTHLVPHTNKELLKKKYHLAGKKVLSTFGLLSAGKSIETTLDALPAVVMQNPGVLFLIIGKTHPSVLKRDGEKYRDMLLQKVETLHLQQHVQFINVFLPLPVLLEYLQLTDIYLFTSKDPNQAVSGTFSYAISCGCPVISTPIPHACEVLKNDAGIIFDFGNSKELSAAVNNLLEDDMLREKISSNGLHRMAATAWENAAVSHAMLFRKAGIHDLKLHYDMPAINLAHIKNMTTPFGMIQFSVISHPDINSGYTLDDNARALVAMCQHFELTREDTSLVYINTYFHFIKYCLQPGGNFLNYADEHKNFTEQNNSCNLEDSNGRAIWALGHLVSVSALLPATLAIDAAAVLKTALQNLHTVHSTRAMAFIIKGLYYANVVKNHPADVLLVKQLANRMVQMYRHESKPGWEWFESYLTYANSILPEAMLCAWMVTGEPSYKEIARSSFDFLLLKIFRGNSIKVISNKSWLHNGWELLATENGGEQPIDVAYTILALSKFYEVFKEDEYLDKMKSSFDWFLGDNSLHQVIYNPATGGCYDGLEESYVNLNQGAESTVSYLMARLTIERNLRKAAIKKQHHGLRPQMQHAGS